MSGTLTILGCGNSTGVPAIGNYWGDCDPNEPKNNRTRPCAMVEVGNTRIVIDTGPDFREQLNRVGTYKVDAALFTHHHGDHVNGIDELRGLKFRNKMDLFPIHANEETLRDLSHRFPYMFEGGAHKVYPPMLEKNTIKNFGQPHHIGDIEFIPFLMDHGSCEAVGYRFGNLAYCTDMLDLDEMAIEVLQGIETWIVDAASYNYEPIVHANLERIFALNKKIGAKQVYLTSLSLSMDYRSLINELPDGYAPAYDGLALKF